MTRHYRSLTTRYALVAGLTMAVLAGGVLLRQCHAQQASSAVSMPVESIQLMAPAGGMGTTLQVEVARSDAEHAQGLMYRRQMDADKGMLFVWPQAQVAKFWMRNTYMPLDMLFFRDGVLVDSVQWARPHDETPVGPDEPVDMVLEVNGGYVTAHKIAPGWRLLRAGR